MHGVCVYFRARVRSYSLPKGTQEGLYLNFPRVSQVVRRRAWRGTLRLRRHPRPRRPPPHSSRLPRVAGLQSRLSHSANEGRFISRLGPVPSLHDRVRWFIVRVMRENRLICFSSTWDKVREGREGGWESDERGLLSSYYKALDNERFLFLLSLLLARRWLSGVRTSAISFQPGRFPKKTKETTTIYRKPCVSSFSPRYDSRSRSLRSLPARKRGSLDHVLPPLRQCRSVSRRW